MPANSVSPSNRSSVRTPPVAAPAFSVHAISAIGFASVEGADISCAGQGCQMPGGRFAAAAPCLSRLMPVLFLVILNGLLPELCIEESEIAHAIQVCTARGDQIGHPACSGFLLGPAGSRSCFPRFHGVRARGKPPRSETACGVEYRGRRPSSKIP